MLNLSRRITKLEATRPAIPTSGDTISLSDLDPAVAAIFITRGCDVGQMSLSELDALADDLRRFTE